MSSGATKLAPKSIDELKALLKDDIKVKVAGKVDTILNTSRL